MVALDTSGISPRVRETSKYLIVLIATASAFFALTKAGLEFSSLSSSAPSARPAIGFAVGAVLLCGYRIWPAVLAAALLANTTSGEAIYRSLIIAAGDTVEAVGTGFLLNLLSGGRNAFKTPAGVIKFALLSVICMTISPTLSLGAATFAGQPESSKLASSWVTWWLSDCASTIILAPVIVLWAEDYPRVFVLRSALESAALFVIAALVGLLAFTPFADYLNVKNLPTIGTEFLGLVAFLGLLPLILAALRGAQRDAATVALILACCVLWGLVAGAGGFVELSRAESIPLSLIFMAIISVLTLTLSAAVAMRKRVETERDENRGQLLASQRLANLGAWMLDIPKGIVSWSDELSKIRGSERGEFQGTLKDFLAHVHEEDRARLEQQITEATHLRQGFKMDGRIVRPDGEICYVQSSAEVVTDDKGVAAKLIGICQDVTDRKKSEEALLDMEEKSRRLIDAVRNYAARNATEKRETQAKLEEAQAQFAQSQKMEAVGQLTGGVAHDFNNLLTIIVGNLETALRNVDTWPEGVGDRVRRLINSAMLGAQRATAVTQRLLAFSRRQPLDPKILDVNKLIAGLTDFLRRSLGETVALETVGAGGLWRIEADPMQLEAAILNLAVNARDAMPNGGKLRIETSNTMLDEDYCRRYTEILPGQFVQITLTDTGEGMSRETLERAFEPFFTTKTAGQGTGLGLSQVYGFVKQSGGHIEMSSELGHGTTVKIYLPRLFGDFRQEDSDSQANTAEGAETILIVEDDHDVRAYVVETLRELNYRVLEAHDADSALGLLDRKDVHIDLLLTDVVLSGMNGRELADEVKTRQPLSKLLFMTGYSRDAIVHDGRLDPGVEMIQKPLTHDALATRVRNILDAGRTAGGSNVSETQIVAERPR
jgi:PAS domain S-box-containing protein